MVVCFATLQQFSELENCFIDGTPLSLGEQQMSKKDVTVSGWDAMSNECGSVHDTVSESLDSETLRRRKTTTRNITSHSRFTGYSPDECYSPAFAHEIVDEYLYDTRWRGLPKNTPSAEEKVTQWMSYGKSQPNEMLDYNTIQLPSPILGHVQDRRSRGRRSRSIILRFEEQKQNSQTQESVIYQGASAQVVKPVTQDSRTKRRKNMDTTSRNVGVEKPLPELPRKGSLKRRSTMGSHNAQDRPEHSSHTRKRSEAATHEVHSEQQQSSLVAQKNHSNLSDRGPMSQQERPMMPRRTSKSNSTKPPSAKVARAPSPKPLRLVMKVNQQDAEQAQRHTMPKSRKSRDEALRKLENVDDSNKSTSQPDRVKSENVGTEVMRKVLGLKTSNAKASTEQIETILRKPALAGRPERPRPAPIDMRAVLEANKNHLNQQIMITTELKKSEPSGLCHTPDEILYSEHPSALIPRPLSLPFRKSAPCDVQIMSPIERLEPSRDRLMRHRRFFDNRPLGRCLDGDGVDEISEGLYDRLIEETKLYEARQSVQTYKQRAFWDNVRLDLNVEDEEEDIEERQKSVEYPQSAGIPVKGRHCMVIVHAKDEQRGRRSY